MLFMFQVDAWLFSDELYRLLEPQPQQQRLPAAACCYPGKKGISLGGLSKAFGLQGLRAGWLVCLDVQLLEQVSVFPPSAICWKVAC
jgi:aspartate/methionine/tyrosine aminotransferase